MNKQCVICSKTLKGQRWRYCSDSCMWVGTTRDLRKNKRYSELKDIKTKINYKRIEDNSSKDALDLIKTLTK